jgi:acetyl/propionyl-CoA carboxylase alpha subunit
VFDSVLVANRGEIARRVLRTLHGLGIRSLAIYTEADRDAVHVREADAAELVSSYLAIDEIMVVAARCDAVHPGYGFLSENPAFARACEEMGVVFIGPSADAIELMGDKVRAKDAAVAAGVPVVPTYTPETAEYPVLVKAAAGGGGRGMRVVERPEDLAEAMAAASREAAAGFGDDRVFLERFLPRARHIEVQVIGDTHGNVLSLGERECSLQRRRQKVVEEAPAPTYDASELCAAAARLSGAIGYRGAGTLEFLVDDDTGEFFFIEMNTRIQVEHPVTELVTGVDLIAAQLTGELPPFDTRGHALELRLTAEDPEKKFMPSPGTVSDVRWPAGPWVRVDTWLEPGVVVPPFYDSLLAKLIVWGATREQCVARAKRALREVRVEGIKTTAPLLARLLDEDWFARGDFHTTTLEEWLA